MTVAIILNLFALACIIFVCVFCVVRGRRYSLVHCGITIVSTFLALGLKGVFQPIIADVLFENTGVTSVAFHSLSDAIYDAFSLLISFVLVFILINILLHSIGMILCNKYLPKEIVYHSLQAVCLGAFQGLLIVFMICVPLNGYFTQAESFNEIQYQSEQIVNVPCVKGYSNSFSSVWYNIIGNDFNNQLTESYTKLNETKCSLETYVSISELLNKTDATLAMTLKNMEDVDEKVSIIQTAGEYLLEAGQIFNNLSANEKVLFQDIINEVNNNSENENVIDKFNASENNLYSAGIALSYIANYIKNSQEEGDIFLTDVGREALLYGLTDNLFVVSMLEQHEINFKVNSCEVNAFKEILNSTSLSVENKDRIGVLCGLY